VNELTLNVQHRVEEVMGRKWIFSHPMPAQGTQHTISNTSNSFLRSTTAMDSY